MLNSVDGQETNVTIFTHKHPLPYEGEIVIVILRSGGVQHNINTSSVHLEYTMCMQRVDVPYQLRGA